MKKLSWIVALGALVAWGVFKAIDWYNGMDADMGNRKPISSADKLGITGTDPGQVAAGGKSRPAPAAGPSTTAPAPVVTASTFVPGVFVCTQDVAAYDPAKPSQLIGKFQKNSSLKLEAMDPITNMIKVSFQQPNGQIIRALCVAKDVGR